MGLEKQEAERISTRGKVPDLLIPKTCVMGEREGGWEGGREVQAEVVPRILVLEPEWVKGCVQNGNWSRGNRLGADTRSVAISSRQLSKPEFRELQPGHTCVDYLMDWSAQLMTRVWCIK